VAVYITIWAFMLLAGISVVWALVWALRRGGLKNTEAQAASIFEADEVCHASTHPSHPLSTRGD
jgi:hypothetical protein